MATYWEVVYFPDGVNGKDKISCLKKATKMAEDRNLNLERVVFYTGHDDVISHIDCCFKTKPH